MNEIRPKFAPGDMVVLAVDEVRLQDSTAGTRASFGRVKVDPLLSSVLAVRERKAFQVVAVRTETDSRGTCVSYVISQGSVGDNLSALEVELIPYTPFTPPGESTSDGQ